MAGLFMDTLRASRILSAEVGKSEYGNMICDLCKTQVSLDAVQGSSVGFLRAIVLSCQIEVGGDRLKIVLRTKNRKGIEGPPKRVTTCLCCTPLGAYRLCNVPMLGAGTGPAGAAVASPESIAETDSDDEADAAMSASRLRSAQQSAGRRSPSVLIADTNVLSQRNAAVCFSPRPRCRIH